MRTKSLFKFASRQPFFKMFSRRRNNKGAMWASLIGIGISAVAMLTRNKGQKKVPSINFQNLMKNNPLKTSSPNISDAALAEFSEELMSKALQNNQNNR
ncbi:hypothetical protein ACQYAD_11885 [Neobacillus sp. SM06]|uniref:hypothetical protein n=1 Tax=Neobacillus sp. SM06 TaxID=3422492 RepID=UPI003D2A7BE2